MAQDAAGNSGTGAVTMQEGGGYNPQPQYPQYPQPQYPQPQYPGAGRKRKVEVAKASPLVCFRRERKWLTLAHRCTRYD